MTNNSKIPAVKGRKWPAIIKTLQNYSENNRSAARTENRPKDPSLIDIWASLLLDLNSLFRKNFSLLSEFEFPVNFEAQFTQTPRITSEQGGIHAYG